MHQPLVFVIGGPTASGKTALAIQIAIKLGTEIINADSRQFYRELKIGVARPSEEELRMAPHHFIASESIHEPLSAGSFAAKARPVLEQILKEKQIVIVCGGSGLYINALLYGFDEVRMTPDEVRLQVDVMMNKGLDGAVQALLDRSPDACDRIDLKNPARVRRALELVLGEGKQIAEIRKGKKHENLFRIAGYYLNPDRSELYKTIHSRTQEMMDAGLEQEARELYTHRDLKVLRTVGYSELFDHFSGIRSLAQTVELIKQHTRNYAKRQLTWFRNRTDFTALDPETALEHITSDLKKYGYTIHQ